MLWKFTFYTMKSIVVFILLHVLLGYRLVSSASTWDYTNGSKGPAKWSKSYATCGGQWQSPINIVTSEATKLVDTGSLTIELRHGAQLVNVGSYEVENSGYFVKITFPGDTWFVKFGNDAGKFEASHIHFHWGSTNSQGSEHTIDGKRYPIEVHLVCFDKTLYANVSEAISQPIGLTVVGIFGHLVTGTPTDTIITRMGNLAKALPNVINATNTTTIPKFDLRSVLTADEGKIFYRYPGSLTEPPCTTNVMWNVIPKSVPVTEVELTLLRNLALESGSPMGNNYRPIQELNSETSTVPRGVYYYENQSSRITVPIIWISIAISWFLIDF